MARAFDEHGVRHSGSLDGWWDFCTDPDNVSLDRHSKRAWWTVRRLLRGDE